MSWFKREMEAFWFSCRHPFGIADVLEEDMSPTPAQITAIQNLIALSKERIELSEPGKTGKPKPVELMAPSTKELAQASIHLIESYMKKIPNEEDIS